MNTPLVTVGIALYNHQDYIEQCLLSVLNQHYPAIELIVIDDGSTDDSYKVAKRCIEQHPERDRVLLRSQENRGMCNTLNAIAQSCHGQYISFVGSDDYWFPEKITDQVAYLETHKEDVLVHSNSVRINANGDTLKTTAYASKVNSGNNVYEALIRRTGGINTPSHLYRTSIYQEIGYYDPQFRFEDTDFWLRLSKKHSVGFIDKVHTAYRWHGANLSNKKNSADFYYDQLIAIYKKNIDEPHLRKYAVNRVCKKALIKSIQSFNFSSARKFSKKMLK